MFLLNYFCVYVNLFIDFFELFLIFFCQLFQLFTLIYFLFIGYYLDTRYWASSSWHIQYVVIWIKIMDKKLALNTHKVEMELAQRGMNKAELARRMNVQRQLVSFAR